MMPSLSASNPTLPFLSDLDASRPSVSLLGGFSPFNKEKLDKERPNWSTWSWDMYVVMSLNWSYDYVTGDAVAPNALLELHAHKNWL